MQMQINEHNMQEGCTCDKRFRFGHLNEIYIWFICPTLLFVRERERNIYDGVCHDEVNDREEILDG